MLSNSPVYAYVPVSDLERGRAFYEQTLQFEPGFEVEGVGVTYNCAKDTAFFMYLSDGAGTNKASTLFWQVDDVYKAVAELRERGVVFEEYSGDVETNDGVMEAGPGRAAWFKDPDGNVLAIVSD